MKSGLYIVTLNNEYPISVNRQDPRIADKAIKVTNENCKFGKAKDLIARRKNYFKTFDEENVNFKPIALIEEIQEIEKSILSKLDNFRVRGRTGRKNEWLENIKPDEVEAIAKQCIVNSGFNYDLLI